MTSFINTALSGAKSHFAELGENCTVQDAVVLGLKYKDRCGKARIGNDALIRAFTVIYADVVIGNDLKTGHFVTIRENTRIGSIIVIGTGTVIENNVEIGDRVKIESNVYIPAHTKIGNDIFIGPNVVLTNDRYPQRMRDEYQPTGPTIEDSVSIGANATIMPGITVREGAFIAAGSVVTVDIPKWSLVRGVPGKIYPLPKKLMERNKAKRW